MDTQHKQANKLINSTSPYLLQHAYNPVNWHEWGSDALEKAKHEDKPIILSIGYSSCHWCHVMEQESFENEDIAQIMNEFFVCIKVDREERPDIDTVYMEAVQAMGVNGGWPLNVFLTPNQKPFYGGTYFPPQNWAQVLTNIHRAYRSQRQKIDESSEQIGEYLMRNDIDRFRLNPVDSTLQNDLEEIYKKLESQFDETWGGMDRAPKFIMPSVWLFLLRHYQLTKNHKALEQVLRTLRHAAMGGIYDQAGGGFARYSVDSYWFVPHFEKMLYDNAQLMSLYAEAYAITKDDELKVILHETFDWLLREMTHESGGFYSALDADSEGKEGKFYVWTRAELKNVLGDDADIIGRYYSVKEEGNWEDENNILIRNTTDDAFIKENNISKEAWSKILREAKEKLRAARSQRVRPGLDDKILTSWNAMMVCGLVDAYKALGDEKFVEAAIRNMHFLMNELADDNTLYRSFKEKRSSIRGFLDDYAYFIQASIRLYEVTFDESWIKKAVTVLHHTLEHFYDSEDGYFHYSDKDAEKLISSKKEIFDNVIPSSNAIMASNLLYLGTLFDNDTWKEMASAMVMPFTHLICSEPGYMCHWAIVLAMLKTGIAEVVMAGPSIQSLRKEWHRAYKPFSIVLGAGQNGTLPLLNGKEAIEGVDTIYVCWQKTCKKPVHTIYEALEQAQ